MLLEISGIVNRGVILDDERDTRYASVITTDSQLDSNILGTIIASNRSTLNRESTVHDY